MTLNIGIQKYGTQIEQICCCTLQKKLLCSADVALMLCQRRVLMLRHMPYSTLKQLQVNEYVFFISSNVDRDVVVITSDMPE